MTLLVDDLRYTLRVWTNKQSCPFVVVGENWITFEGVLTHPEEYKE